MPLITDPIDFLLDVNDDLAIDTDLYLTSGLAGVVQGIRQRIQTFKGEWFLDLDHGVPYYQDLLGKKFDDNKALVAFRDAILSTPGVITLNLLNVSYSGTTRKLTVNWQATTIFGDTTLDTLEVT